MERLLVQHCAPTLACIKSGTLFSVRFDSVESLEAQLEIYQQSLAERGVRLKLLRKGERCGLVYVYRAHLLERDWQCTRCRELLHSLGYCCNCPFEAVETLCRRIEGGESFPHEIGLFLGYPIEDVLGFIKNEGRNALLLGPWKVYHDVDHAMKRFELFKKCNLVYQKLYSTGYRLEQLTIAA